MTISTSQISVGSSGTLIAAPRSRNNITIANHGTTPMFLGDVSVTLTNGILLAGVVGASITLPTSSAIYGITSTGTQVVGVLEDY